MPSWRKETKSNTQVAHKTSKKDTMGTLSHLEMKLVRQRLLCPTTFGTRTWHQSQKSNGQSWPKLPPTKKVTDIVIFALRKNFSYQQTLKTTATSTNVPNWHRSADTRQNFYSKIPRDEQTRVFLLRILKTFIFKLCENIFKLCENTLI